MTLHGPVSHRETGLIRDWGLEWGGSLAYKQGMDTEDVEPREADGRG